MAHKKCHETQYTSTIMDCNQRELLRNYNRDVNLYWPRRLRTTLVGASCRRKRRFGKVVRLSANHDEGPGGGEVFNADIEFNICKNQTPDFEDHKNTSRKRLIL